MRFSIRVAVAVFMLGSTYATTVRADDGFLTSPLPVRNMYAPMMRFFDPAPDSAMRSYSNLSVAHRHI